MKKLSIYFDKCANFKNLKIYYKTITKNSTLKP